MNQMDFILTSLISFAYISIVQFHSACCPEIPKCEIGFNSCCPDFRWNVESKQCEKCTPGYIGENCTSKCPYPFYGEACQEKCNCEKDICDFYSGCPLVTTESEALSPTLTTLTENHNWTSGDHTETNFTRKITRQFQANNILLVLIIVFGCMDIIMICAHLSVCFYDRKYDAILPEIGDAYENYPGNTMYENVQIIFQSNS
ncbi:uncharacterized protein LOC134248687 [Saccostrea cucullata]|uniref:uncharacterized protein LOC134248687 n=1 Tax=Saccostrea cuccullata TaxID=36930 RepID=UPI002ED1E340